MSERNIGTTTSPETVTGIAMILGETKSELRHLADDTVRRFEELRVEQDERIAALEATVADIPARLDRVLETLEANHSRNGDTKTKSTETASPAPPARNRGERSDAYYKRIAAWAKEQGMTAPPKPRPLDNADTYDARVQIWIQEIAD